MAVTFKPQHDVEVGVADQAVWGTGITAGASFEGLHHEPAPLTRGLNVRMPNRNNASRQPLDEEVRIDWDSVEHSVAIAGQATKDTLAKSFYGLIQNVAENASTPFEKVYTILSGQPAFETNAGYFATICSRHGTAAGEAESIEDAIVRSMTISLHPTNNAGRLHVSSDWLGRDYKTAQAVTGAFIARDIDYYEYADLGTMTVDNQAAILMDMSLTITNGAVGKGIDTGLVKFDSTALMGYQMSGSMSFMWDSIIHALGSSVNRNDVKTIIMEWGTPGSDGHLKFEFEVKYANAGIEEGEIRLTKFDVVGVNEINGMAKITLSDAIDRTF